MAVRCAPAATARPAVTARPEVECLVLCLRTGDDEDILIAERLGDQWCLLGDDGAVVATTAGRLRTLLRTRSMEAADRWRVPPVVEAEAAQPVAVVEAAAIMAALRRQDDCAMQTALTDAGLRNVPLWLRELDGSVRGQVTVLRHTAQQIEVLVDVLATGSGWVCLRADDDLIHAQLVTDARLQSWLDAAVPPPEPD